MEPDGTVQTELINEKDQKGPPNYGNPTYWQDRYQQMESGDRYDWLQDYRSLKPFLQKCIGSNYHSAILNIGCGNGSIQDDLYLDGYCNITNIDISPTLIESMKAQNTHKYMKYVVMDATDLKYPDESFDLVFDKSTIDTLQCSNSPLVSTGKMIKQAYRVLRPKGVYFVVSYGHPRDRLQHLQRGHLCFDIEVKRLPQSEQMKESNRVHHIYMCTKSKRAKPNKSWKQGLKQLQEEEKKLFAQDEN